MNIYYAMYVCLYTSFCRNCLKSTLNLAKIKDNIYTLFLNCCTYSRFSCTLDKDI